MFRDDASGKNCTVHATMATESPIVDVNRCRNVNTVTDGDLLEALEAIRRIVDGLDVETLAPADAPPTCDLARLYLGAFYAQYECPRTGETFYHEKTFRPRYCPVCGRRVRRAAP